MSFLPPFRLHNLHQVLTTPHVSTTESTPSDGQGNARTVPPQSPPGHLAQCLAWAREAGQLQHASQFAARQVSEELFEQFLTTPAFGRDLSERLEAFHEPESAGDLLLVDAGGEAIVFGDPGRQKVIKLFAPPIEGRFGWVLYRDPNGRWGIRGGSLIEALWRFAWFEACFVSGLDLDVVGLDADYLTLSQPFFGGRGPCADELEEWMTHCGWQRWSPATDQATVVQHSWRRGDYVATDVLPRNAILTDADDRIRAMISLSPRCPIFKLFPLITLL
jgi:hypothetical protein